VFASNRVVRVVLRERTVAAKEDATGCVTLVTVGYLASAAIEEKVLHFNFYAKFNSHIMQNSMSI